MATSTLSSAPGLDPGTQLVPNTCLWERNRIRGREGRKEGKRERREGPKEGRIGRQTSRYWMTTSFLSETWFESHFWYFLWWGGQWHSQDPNPVHSHFFFFFRATLAPYGSSRARGLIGAIGASLYHSHSNIRSEPCLQLLTATLDP